MKENTLQLTLGLQAIIFSCRKHETHDYPFQIFGCTHCSDAYTPLSFISMDFPWKQLPDSRPCTEIAVAWTPLSKTQEFTGRCEDARQTDDDKLPKNTAKHAKSDPEQVNIDNLIPFKLFNSFYFFFKIHLPDWQATNCAKFDKNIFCSRLKSQIYG